MVAKFALCLIAFLTISKTEIVLSITMEQFQQSSGTLRSVCLPKTKANVDLVDGLQQGKFPEDKPVKCYVNCIMELLGTMKKGKLMYENGMKQIEILIPDEFRDNTKQALTICKDSPKGIKDHCEAGYALLKCFWENNKTYFFA